MAANRPAEPLVVVAIDFGTTFSGYAFSFASTKEVMLNTNWASNTGSAYYKTPTCLLTEKTGTGYTFVKFGFEAHEVYGNEISQKKSLCLFDEFKMELFKTHQVSG